MMYDVACGTAAYSTAKCRTLTVSAMEKLVTTGWKSDSVTGGVLVRPPVTLTPLTTPYWATAPSSKPSTVTSYVPDSSPSNTTRACCPSVTGAVMVFLAAPDEAVTRISSSASVVSATLIVPLIAGAVTRSQDNIAAESSARESA